MRELPYFVQRRLEDFQPYEREAFLHRYRKSRKSVSIAYFLLLFTGWHYAYLNNWRNQIICLVTLWGLFVWWFIDWFRIPSMIRSHNEEVASNLLNEFGWIKSKESIKQVEQNPFQQWKQKNPTGTVNEFYRLQKR